MLQPGEAEVDQRGAVGRPRRASAASTASTATVTLATKHSIGSGRGRGRTWPGGRRRAHQAGGFRRRARHVDHTDQDDVAGRDLVDGGDDVVGEHRVVALGQQVANRLDVVGARQAQDLRAVRLIPGRAGTIARVSNGTGSPFGGSAAAVAPGRWWSRRGSPATGRRIVVVTRPWTSRPIRRFQAGHHLRRRAHVMIAPARATSEPRTTTTSPAPISASNNSSRRSHCSRRAGRR